MALHKQWLDGKVAVLPLELVRSAPGIHLQNCQHWTPNKGKPAGRSITDFSENSDISPHSRNGSTPSEKAAVSERYVSFYGALSHPTLPIIIALILAAGGQVGN